LLTTLLLAIAAFALTRKYDPAAQSSLQTAVIAAAIVLAVFVLFHIVHTPLLLHEATRARKALPHPGFGVLGIAVLIGMMGGGYEFYERVWPREPPSHSKNRLHWADAGVFSDNRSIEAGKTIVFRFQFTPNEGLVTNTHIVGACVVTEGPTFSQDTMMITRFQDMVKENLQGAESAQGPEVAPGIFVYEDVPRSAFSANQADKVLSGSGRVYILLWLGWIGQDGVKRGSILFLAGTSGTNPERGRCEKMEAMQYSCGYPTALVSSLHPKDEPSTRGIQKFANSLRNLYNSTSPAYSRQPEGTVDSSYWAVLIPRKQRNSSS
jgi:hypothetical protein